MYNQTGKSVNSFDLKGKKYPLLYGKSAASKSCDEESTKQCSAECFDKSLVKGSILVCNDASGSIAAETSEAMAAIFQVPKVDVVEIVSFPLAVLSEDEFNSLVSYIESTDSPQAAILKTEAIFNQRAPKIASFSSRGPNNITADLLKLDISAPGVEILAAFSPNASLFSGDTRRVKFSIESGTSMACPHVAGVAAYVKTFHPLWSPSMIKSATMTTAWPMTATETGFVSSESAHGAGPIATLTPGLVYESTKADYISFLCGLNYSGPILKKHHRGYRYLYR